ISQLNIDYLVFSGHKIYSPFGTGVLVVKKGILAFSPQEKGTIQSFGDENAAGIAALGRSITLLQRAGLELISSKERELTGNFLAKARNIPQLDIYGIADPASPDFPRKGGVISFSIKGWMPNRIAGQLAMKGIGIRNGCHCTHLLVKHILKVPGWAQKIQRIIVNVLPGMELPGVARVSMGIGNTPEETDHLLRILTSMSRAKEFQRQNRNPENRLSNKLYKIQIEEWIRNIENQVFGTSAPQ
ncbi:MAG TPA: aminotransferase class V-fold PLP-dependent enzyme, partial [Prolixibacteraceae bacterium]|nr:aminotransferase class V-fold PLP-dependent enzyme [Prolixibacteraceae bacterium]